MKIVLVTWSALSAGVQGSLALFFQSPYCTVLNKKFDDLLPTFYKYVYQPITAVSVPYCISKSENLLHYVDLSHHNCQIICIELCIPGLISSIN